MSSTTSLSLFRPEPMYWGGGSWLGDASRLMPYHNQSYAQNRLHTYKHCDPFRTQQDTNNPNSHPT